MPDEQYYGLPQLRADIARWRAEGDSWPTVYSKAVIGEEDFNRVAQGEAMPWVRNLAPAAGFFLMGGRGPRAEIAPPETLPPATRSLLDAVRAWKPPSPTAVIADPFAPAVPIPPAGAVPEEFVSGPLGNTVGGEWNYILRQRPPGEAIQPLNPETYWGLYHRGILPAQQGNLPPYAEPGFDYTKLPYAERPPSQFNLQEDARIEELMRDPLSSMQDKLDYLDQLTSPGEMLKPLPPGRRSEFGNYPGPIDVESWPSAPRPPMAEPAPTPTLKQQFLDAYQQEHGKSFYDPDKPPGVTNEQWIDMLKEAYAKYGMTPPNVPPVIEPGNHPYGGMLRDDFFALHQPEGPYSPEVLQNLQQLGMKEPPNLSMPEKQAYWNYILQNPPPSDVSEMPGAQFLQDNQIEAIPDKSHEFAPPLKLRPGEPYPTPPPTFDFSQYGYVVPQMPIYPEPQWITNMWEAQPEWLGSDSIMA